MGNTMDDFSGKGKGGYPISTEMAPLGDTYAVSPQGIYSGGILYAGENNPEAQRMVAEDYLANEKVKYQTQALGAYNDIASKAGLNPFASQLSQTLDQQAQEVLKNAPNKYAADEFNKFRLNLQAKLSSQAIKHNSTARQGWFLGETEQRAKELSGLAASSPGMADMLKEQIKQFEPALMNNGLNRVQALNFINKSIQGIDENAALTKIRNNPQEVLDEIKNGKYAEHGIDWLTKIEQRAQSVLQANTIALNQSLDRTASQITKMQLTNPKPYDLEQAPEALKPKIEEVNQLINAYQSLGKLNANDLRNYTNHQNPTVATFAQQMLENLSKDPLTYAERVGKVPPTPPIDLNNPETAVQIIKNVNEASTALGVDVPILKETKDKTGLNQAEKFVDIVKLAGNGNEGMDKLNKAVTWLNALGNKKDEALNIIGKKDAFAGLILGVDDPTLRNQLIQGQKNIKAAPIKDENVAMIYNNRVGGSGLYSEDSNYANKVIQAAKAKYAYEKVIGSGQPDIDSIVKDLAGVMQVKKSFFSFGYPTGKIDSTDTPEQFLQTISQLKPSDFSKDKFGNGEPLSRNGSIFSSGQPVDLTDFQFKALGKGWYQVNGPDGLPLAVDTPNGRRVAKINLAEFRKNRFK